MSDDGEDMTCKRYALKSVEISLTVRYSYYDMELSTQIKVGLFEAPQKSRKDPTHCTAPLTD